MLLLRATLLQAGQLARQRRLTAAWLCALPLLTAFVCVVQHHVMDTKFPTDRTALFFFPMFALALLGSSAGARGLGHALLGGAALLLVINGARSLNFSYFVQWRYDASTARMLSQLGKVRDRGHRIELGVNWLFEPSINYYRAHRKLRWLARVGRGSLHDDGLDYYYYLPDDQALMAPRQLEQIQQYKVSEATLARTKVAAP